VVGEYFNPVGSDFPGTELTATKKLTSVVYHVASYPGAIIDNPQLCYYTPYASTPSLCLNVTAGATATTVNFNPFTFGNGVQVRIMHNITGTPNADLKPSGAESVIFNFSY